MTNDPRIDAACKARFKAKTNGACDGFPDPCSVCDCFYESQWADHERDVMRHILAAADAVDPLRVGHPTLAEELAMCQSASKMGAELLRQMTKRAEKAESAGAAGVPEQAPTPIVATLDLIEEPVEDSSIVAVDGTSTYRRALCGPWHQSGGTAHFTWQQVQSRLKYVRCYILPPVVPPTPETQQ